MQFGRRTHRTQNATLNPTGTCFPHLGRAGWRVVLLALVAAAALSLAAPAQAATDEGTLTPDDPGDNDYFGEALALDGDTAVIGTPGHDQGAQDDTRADRGAAYVFTHSDGEWSQEAKLTHTEVSDGDEFGAAVAVDGDTVAVGAPGAHSDGGSGLAGDYGAVFVFTAEGDGYTQETVLYPDDTFDGQEVGSALALRGDTLLVGAPGNQESPSGFDDFSGKVFVYERSGGSWDRTATLDRQDDGRAAFGSAVTFDGETALVGVPGYGGTFSVNAGDVYAYSAGDGWNKTAEFDPEDGEGGARFGAALAHHGDVALVGAPNWDRDSDGEDHGASFAFEEGDDGWTQVADLSPETLDGFTDYGSSVALSSDVAMVGAPGNDSAYEIIRSDGDWSEPSPFRPDDGEDGDDFGSALVLEGTTALVGAPGHDGDGERQGVVHPVTPDLGSDDGAGGPGGGDGEDGGNGAPGPGAVAALAAGLGAAVAARRDP